MRSTSSFIYSCETFCFASISLDSFVVCQNTAVVAENQRIADFVVAAAASAIGRILHSCIILDYSKTAAQALLSYSCFEQIFILLEVFVACMDLWL